MTDKLPPNLLALFAPRPPLRWLAAPDHAPEERKTTKITGLADYLPHLAAYKENDGYLPTESWLQARDRKKLEKKEKQEKLLSDGPHNYNPAEDANVRGDPFKTLIVARLSYDANESDLEKEFGRFGPIERIRIITDTHAHERPNKKKKPHRGYAFVVFDREKDMRAALDGCDGIRIKDRRIKVDVERGRTVKGWKPRRLGGGLGGRGYTKAAPPRPSGPGGFGGGFGGRDGFRGGFPGARGRGGGFRGQDRGFRGGGGFGGGGRDRGFGQQNGYAPPNAPAGPGSDNRFGGDRERDRDRSDRGDRVGGGGYNARAGPRSYDDRSGGPPSRYDRDRRTGANFEPVRDRREYRDSDRSRDDDNRKRGYEGGYEDPRKLRRY
ncbi:U1 small nuclear ribonucleoprotein of 70kDa MW N terminal-domain-containing protein [Xylaria bambusicola]|uniref:U1 small nuclear ribonucleoprotein of 70kDa MW N terminal-domain-containing protein n=1 Tax=Xylaria bambusicola TaxID=326684 RepID=UPI0020082648|nr:U1 small nuclear ribonucleoprotein of 70kDa MW N terminal-domain-containing protein [Xylaria bambusicola]KAI0512587.1 U1 small nuclear ribonucleoprotein of 70kDa MW N terminal-domain-containing protein [Xylaria bambusicola]